MQEAFAAAWTSLPQFEGRSSLRTWLFAITAHKVRSLQRRRTRTAMPLPFAPDDEVDRRAVGPASCRPKARTCSRRSNAALRELPPGPRSTWLLREVEGLSYDQIAEVSGTTTSTVRGQLHRARGAPDPADGGVAMNGDQLLAQAARTLREHTDAGWVALRDDVVAAAVRAFRPSAPVRGRLPGGELLVASAVLVSRVRVAPSPTSPTPARCGSRARRPPDDDLDRLTVELVALYGTPAGAAGRRGPARGRRPRSPRRSAWPTPRWTAFGVDVSVGDVTPDRTAALSLTVRDEVARASPTVRPTHPGRTRWRQLTAPGAAPVPRPTSADGARRRTHSSV